MNENTQDSISTLSLNFSRNKNICTMYNIQTPNPLASEETSVQQIEHLVNKG
jgi:hypothetical protein